MNPFRAKRIADHFLNIGTFAVTNQIYGVTVTFRGNKVYFDNEHSLWAFLFHIAHAEAEARLAA